MDYTYTLEGEQQLALFLDDLGSVEDLSYYDCDDYKRTVFKYKNLLITTIYLEDVGLTGVVPYTEIRNCQQNSKYDETLSEVLKEMSDMGLPRSFGYAEERGREGKRRGKGRLEVKMGAVNSQVSLPTQTQTIAGAPCEASNSDVLSEAVINADADYGEANDDAGNKSSSHTVRFDDTRAVASAKEQEPISSPPRILSSVSSRTVSEGSRRVRLDGESAACLRLMLPRRAAKYWFQRFSLFSRFKDTEYYMPAFRIQPCVGVPKPTNLVHSTVATRNCQRPPDVPLANSAPGGHGGGVENHNWELRKAAALRRLAKQQAEEDAQMAKAFGNSRDTSSPKRGVDGPERDSENEGKIGHHVGNGHDLIGDNGYNGHDLHTHDREDDKGHDSANGNGNNDNGSDDDTPAMDLSETILLDEESWWSVTPEILARHQARRCVNLVLAGREMLARAYGYEYVYRHTGCSTNPGNVPDVESGSNPQQHLHMADYHGDGCHLRNLDPGMDRNLDDGSTDACDASKSSLREEGVLSDTQKLARNDPQSNSSSPGMDPSQALDPVATARPSISLDPEPAGLLAVEGCCGCGGNVIQLAAACGRVIAVDNNPRRITMARHNAGVYGVRQQCEFRCEDFVAFAYRATAAAYAYSTMATVAPTSGETGLRPGDSEATLTDGDKPCAIEVSDLHPRIQTTVPSDIERGYSGSGSVSVLETSGEVGGTIAMIHSEETPNPGSKRLKSMKGAAPGSDPVMDPRRGNGEPEGEPNGTGKDTGSQSCDSSMNKRPEQSAQGSTPQSPTSFAPSTLPLPDPSITLPISADVVFFSPPWGGPKYSRYGNLFDVSAPLPGLDRSLEELLPLLSGMTTWRQECIIGIFLPRNLDLNKLNELVLEGTFWEVERNFINGALKGVTVYMRPPIYAS